MKYKSSRYNFVDLKMKWPTGNFSCDGVIRVLEGVGLFNHPNTLPTSTLACLDHNRPSNPLCAYQSIPDARHTSIHICFLRNDDVAALRKSRVRDPRTRPRHRRHVRTLRNDGTRNL